MNKREIKVLNVIETLGRGGAECLVLRALKRLDKQRFCPAVISLSGETDLKKEFEAVGIPVTCLGLKTVYNWQDGIWRLYKIIRKEKYDIVHTHLFFANIYGRIAAKMAGVHNIVTTLHNPDYTYEDNGRFSYRIRKFIDSCSGKICNRYFLAVSNFVKQDYQKQLGYKNIEVLYNCVDVASFNRADNNKRSELGLSDEDVLILNIGRLHPQKGQMYLLEAFEIIHKRDPRYKLIIIGKGDMEAELKQKAVNAGIEKSVIFLKERNDIPEIMHACDIFVSPSIYEGFGIALVEAMACGMPVVASSIDTFTEIIKDKTDGLIVEMGNPEKLAGTISDLIQDKEKRRYLGENAKKKTLERFDVNAHTKKLEHLYEKLACNTDRLR